MMYSQTNQMITKACEDAETLYNIYTCKSLDYDTTVFFPTLETAIEYTKFLLNHTEKPVSTIGTNSYTCHVIRIIN